MLFVGGGGSAVAAAACGLIFGCIEQFFVVVVFFVLFNRNQDRWRSHRRVFSFLTSLLVFVFFYLMTEFCCDSIFNFITFF